MYHQTFPVMELNLELSLCSLYVTDIVVINEPELPAGLKYLMETGTKDTWAQLVTYWLKNRSIPDDRHGLDELLQSLYQLPPHRFGRMYPYKHTALVLSYFASGFDRYYISPDTPQTICHVLQDQRFWGLYTWLPAGSSGPCSDNPDIAGALMGCPSDSPLFHGSFRTHSFTIPSRLPSWWDKRRLVQKLPRKEDRARAECFRDIADRMGMNGVRYLSGDTLITDFSGESGEVTWLSELGLCDRKGTVEKAAAGVFGRDLIEKLQEFTKQAEKADIVLSIGRLGFICSADEAKCIAVL